MTDFDSIWRTLGLLLDTLQVTNLPHGVPDILCYVVPAFNIVT